MPPKPPTKNYQIAQLRTQLEEEQRSNATLIQIVDTQQATIDRTLLQLKVAEESLIQTRSTSPFLRKLPVEIRLRIYELLLVNPKLSETESIGKRVNNGKDAKFELTPAILCTCKAIQSEAEPVLYGSNTFVIECIGGYGPLDCLHFPQSPLTRYVGPDYEDFDDSDGEDEIGRSIEGIPGSEIHFDFTRFKAMQNVKHWRIITAAYKPTPSNPAPAKSFVHFCQELCQQAPTQPRRTLEIVLALAKIPAIQNNPKTEEAQYQFSEKQLKLLLQPLSLLRDIKLSLNIAQFTTDLPVSTQLCGTSLDYYFPYSEAQTVEVNLERFMNLAPPTVQKYYALVEDLSPIEKVFKMHKRLEQYAIAFERSGEFSRDLCTLQRGYEGDVREVRHYGWQLPKPSIGNPFKGLPLHAYHPVELAFSRAIVAKDKEAVAEFKAARASVLRELQPQYRRMIDASKQLRAFVEMERGAGVFHKCDGCGVFHQYEEDPYDGSLGADLDRYIYELDKIALLLHRTMPDHLQVQVKKGTTMYDDAYYNSEREMLFRKLRWMQKQDFPVKDPSKIARWAKRLVEQMWAECGRASLYRENLFKEDTTDIGCKINKKLGAGLMDEELEWIMDEPDSDGEFYHAHRLMGD
ncbi:hypothetical protein SBOR_4984 [Sclerotinia borealis F-4128]|uniref:F-box domain-containing protein n=1 Tax=Sclerotinia borealis (strain F-4128) TaxID=1432307 RepID=W9CCY9_SCLBF|nr:hypothetical protein SBOR_4984 [Sclerotinia borealis F-4128]